MNTREPSRRAALTSALLLAAGIGVSAEAPVRAKTNFTRPETDDGFAPIFDGRTLKDWDGAPGFWSAEDGLIIGRSTTERPAGVTFLIWRGGEPADFELKLELQFDGRAGANSGVQYRSRVSPYPKLHAPPPASGPAGSPVGPPGGGRFEDLFNPRYERWNLAGYQCDVDVGTVGGLYEEGGPPNRGYLARPGQCIALASGRAPRELGGCGLPPQSEVPRPSDWNALHVVASGGVLAHLVNGKLSVLAFDEDRARRSLHGFIGIQLESTAAGVVRARNIRLKLIR